MACTLRLQKRVSQFEFEQGYFLFVLSSNKVWLVGPSNCIDEKLVACHKHGHHY